MTDTKNCAGLVMDQTATAYGKEIRSVNHPFFDRHQKLLDSAVSAIRARTYWSAYAEIPSGKIYGENAKAEGQAAFEARLNKPFRIDQPGTTGSVGAEVSPYGKALGVTYPKADLKILLQAAK